MKKTLLFSGVFLFFFLFFARGGWLPTAIRLDTGDSPGAYASYNPQISCWNDNVYAVWRDYRNGSADIYFNYSTNRGATWQTPDIRLDTGGQPDIDYGMLPQISCSGSNVYAVWRDYRNGGADIYFNYSTDGGASWQTPDIRLDTGDPPGEEYSLYPQIACSGNNVYAVWRDNRNGSADIYFNYSTNGGATWQTPDIRLDNGDPLGDGIADQPQIACSGNNVYVVWYDYKSYSLPQIYFNYSTNGGASWQTSDIRLDTGTKPGGSWAKLPQIACSGNNVYVVWWDYRSDINPDIYFNYSTDGGASWQTPDIRLDTGDPPGASWSQSPQIICSDNNVYVIWCDFRNDTSGVYFNYSTDRGATWQTPDIRLNTGDPHGGQYGMSPQLACSGDAVYAVWQGWPGISFNYSMDGGANWRMQDTPLDTGDIPGFGPQVTCTENNIYVVWSDYRNGDSDIYFNTASLLAIDIKANGSDGPVTISEGETLLVTIDFDAGIQTGEDADGWVLMKTSDPKPNNWYYFDMPTRSWMLGRSPTRQGSLFDVTTKKVPKTSGLAPGTYTFYFAVDMAMNGLIDVDLAYYDKVKVTINP